MDALCKKFFSNTGFSFYQDGGVILTVFLCNLNTAAHDIALVDDGMERVFGPEAFLEKLGADLRLISLQLFYILKCHDRPGIGSSDNYGNTAEGYLEMSDLADLIDDQVFFFYSC